jgi:uncharacterized MAPEG superfamily protein
VAGYPRGVFLANVSLLAAFLLIFVPRMVVARAQARVPGGYDNAMPREQQAKLDPVGKRAQGAHMNAFESFAPFAAAVLLAMTQAPHRAETIGLLAAAHVGLRVLYTALYIGNKPSARSGVWMLATLATIALFVLPLLG